MTVASREILRAGGRIYRWPDVLEPDGWCELPLFSPKTTRPSNGIFGRFTSATRATRNWLPRTKRAHRPFQTGAQVNTANLTCVNVVFGHYDPAWF